MRMPFPSVSGWPTAIQAAMAENARLADIRLDERTVVRRNADIEHERAVAIYDLLEENSFVPAVEADGPYNLVLSVSENRLLFDIRDSDDAESDGRSPGAAAVQADGEGLFHRLRKLFRGDQDRPARARSKPSTWAGAACTTKVRNCC